MNIRCKIGWKHVEIMLSLSSEQALIKHQPDPIQSHNTDEPIFSSLAKMALNYILFYHTGWTLLIRGNLLNFRIRKHGTTISKSRIKTEALLLDCIWAEA
jgi:hypothetical protein